MKEAINISNLNKVQVTVIMQISDTFTLYSTPRKEKKGQRDQSEATNQIHSSLPLSLSVLYFALDGNHSAVSISDVESTRINTPAHL